MLRLTYRYLTLALLLPALWTQSGHAQSTPASACPDTTVVENEVLAKQWVRDVLNRAGEDVDVVDTLLPKDYVHHAGFRRPVVRGREAFKQYVSTFFASGSFTDHRSTTDQVVAADDRVVASWTIDAVYQRGQDGTVPAGTPVTWTGITIMRVECGRIVETWTEADNLARLQQIGVIPSQNP